MSGENGGLPRVIAVTGSSGLIGRRLLARLEGCGAEIRVLRRAPESVAGCKVIRGDLGDAAALQELVRGAEAVVHLAGAAHSELRGEVEYVKAYAVNVTGTQALVSAAAEAGVRHFVYLSSAHVYAGQRGELLREDAATAMDAGYAGMKLEAEAMLAEVAGRGMAVSVLRPCLVYGPGVRHNLAALMRALRGGYYVSVRGAETSRSMASVDTVAAAAVHLLRHPELAGTYNVADREPVVLERWVECLAEVMGVRKPLAVPPGVLGAAAAAGSVVGRWGLRAPLTRASLRKLATPFSLSVEKLAATGFLWPETQEAVMREMAQADDAG